MKIEDFDYELPESLIAQHPSADRGASRLMVVDRSSGEVSHVNFSHLPELVPPGYLTVLNNSRVLPARLTAVKASGARIEVLLLREIKDSQWEVLLKPARKVRPGERLIFEEGILEAVLVGAAHGFSRRLQFDCRGDLRAWIWEKGQMPLPPYIKRPGGDSQTDRERYQTVYSAIEGSVAAPTAGLHFTNQLLGRIQHEFVTLHVGYGTFQPVRVPDIREHQMETEYFEVSPRAAARITRHIRSGGKLLAVGTTTTRVLESLYQQHSKIRAGRGQTDLFIYPGYQFEVVNALVTNFHLPRSTLFMLVGAFAGTELMHRCYREAVRTRYRFYSYGDAMLVL